MERRLLLGSSGFVGTTLRRQAEWTDLVHRPNVAEIDGGHFELVVCAAAPAAKWLANQDEAGDRQNIRSLIGHLATISAESFALVSTIDVYPNPSGVDELTAIDPHQGSAYGQNRLELEAFVRTNFPQSLVIRLPALFGSGLRKNFVFDLLNRRNLHLTDCRAVFQFYDMSRLWADIEVASVAGGGLVNLVTEPVSAHVIAARCFGIDFVNTRSDSPPSYDVRTTQADLFGGRGPYIASAESVLEALTRFAVSEPATPS